jgi:hypothetical protein
MYSCSIGWVDVRVVAVPDCRSATLENKPRDSLGLLEKLGAVRLEAFSKEHHRLSVLMFLSKRPSARPPKGSLPRIRALVTPEAAIDHEDVTYKCQDQDSRVGGHDSSMLLAFSLRERINCGRRHCWTLGVSSGLYNWRVTYLEESGIRSMACVGHIDRMSIPCYL